MSGIGGLAREVLIDFYPSHGLDTFGKCSWACFFAAGVAAIWKEHRSRLATEAQSKQQIAAAEQRLQQERDKKDGPQVVFEYAFSRRRRPNDLPNEKVVTLRNSGQMDAFDLTTSEIRNGAYWAEIPTIPCLKAGSETTIQIDVHYADGVVVGGLMTLLGAEKAKDAPDLEHAMTAKRRVPVKMTYRDITDRNYQTDFEIEYSYLYSTAQALFIRHQVLESSSPKSQT